MHMTNGFVEQGPERDNTQSIPPTVSSVARPDAPALAPPTLAARVVIVSELRLLRDGLADALTRSMGIRVVATVPDAQRARAAMAAHEPTLVLIDIELSDSLALVHDIHDSPRAPRIVVFAVSDSQDALLPYIEAGLDGYVGTDRSTTSSPPWKA